MTNDLLRSEYLDMSGGEFSPWIEGRADTDQYKAGSRLIEGFVVTETGALAKCPGTEYINQQADSSKPGRIYAVSFSDGSKYILVFEDLELRIIEDYVDGAFVEELGSTLVLATPWTWDDLPNLRFQPIQDVIYVVDGAHPVYKIAKNSSDDWAVETVKFLGGPITSSNADYGFVVTYSTRYGRATVTANKDVFTADMVDGAFMIKAGYGTVEAVASARSATVLFSEEIPNTTTVTRGVELLVGAWTVSAGSVGTNAATQLLTMNKLAVADCIVAKTFVGKASTAYMFAFTILQGTDCASASRVNVKVTDATPDTLFEVDLCRVNESEFFTFMTDAAGFATVTITMKYNGTDGDLDFITCREKEVANGFSTWYWAPGAFSDENGFPATIFEIEQRLGLGRTTKDPNGFWLSRTALYENFYSDDTSTASAGIFQKLNAKGRPPEIYWAAVKDDLFLGTSMGVWRVFPPGSTSGISPSNIAARQEIVYGSSNAEPLIMDGVLLYAQKSGKKVRSITFDITDNAWKSSDMSKRAAHLLSSKVVRWAWQQEPSPVLWACKADGTMVGVHFDKDEKFNAWFRRTTTGDVADLTISTDDDGVDRLWLLAKRTIDSVDTYCIERMALWDFENIENHMFLDCAKTTIVDPAGATAGGFDHLDGQEVDVVADGAYVGKMTPVLGDLEFDDDVSIVHAGFNYPAKWRPRRLADKIDTGTIHGVPVRVAKFVVQLYLASSGLYIESDAGERSYIFTRTPEMNMDEPPALMTEDVDLYPLISWSSNMPFTIVHELPLGINILGAVAHWEPGE